MAISVHLTPHLGVHWVIAYYAGEILVWFCPEYKAGKPVNPVNRGFVTDIVLFNNKGRRVLEIKPGDKCVGPDGERLVLSMHQSCHVDPLTPHTYQRENFDSFRDIWLKGKIER